MKQKRKYLGVILCLIFIVPTTSIGQFTNKYPLHSPTEKQWLPYIDFNVSKFKKPHRKFGPYTRWWWPGNDVTNKELKREIQLFAHNGFAGVEIQPFSIGINPNTPQDQLNRIYSWDSNTYYEKLHAVMNQAKKAGITVDLTAGSGWPLSTPVTTPESGMVKLTYADTVVSGGQQINIPVPKDLSHLKTQFRTSKNPDFSLARLQTVVAARICKQDSGQVFLDSASVAVITDYVSDQQINWEIPEEGKWQVIAFWSIPTMEANPFAAQEEPLLVVNHLDSTKLHDSYNYLFGIRTGLKEYYGDPLRAIFNDSYEFNPVVQYAGNLFNKFQNNRGYRIESWLPTIMRLKAGGSFHAPNMESKFVMTNQGERLKYDYNVTLSDILIEQLIVGSNKWMDHKGLLHRTQPYGPPQLDVIAASGHTNIPGTEQLYNGGSEGSIKMVTSGAHLYNRPIITQESYVFNQRDFMTTPQKIIALSNKAFTAGVNQIIYHGSPYKYMNGYGEIGWSPFTNSNISSHINETNPFWKDIKDVNSFITRSQYVLRSGTPQADVLIYNPMIDINVGPNPNEIFVGGYFKGVEPKPDDSIYSLHMPDIKEKFSGFWETINKLEASGITLDYVNDESLQQAKMKGGLINIRGNKYKAIILPHVPYTSLTAAEKIDKLSRQSANLLVIEDLPARQPSFLNYKKNDRKTQQFIDQAFHQSSSQQLPDAGLMDKWISNLPKKIRFTHNYEFIRQSVRKLKDGSQLHYLWNMSDQWQHISLTADTGFKQYYWLNPSDGTIAKNNKNELSQYIPPYSSIILYASVESVPNNILSVSKPPLEYEEYIKAKKVRRIKRWNISSGDTSVKNSPLFDWRNKKTFKFKSAKGVYTTSFNLNKNSQKKYFLNLGEVYFTAAVHVNDQYTGKRLWSPYILDITDRLRPGRNKIKILITPPKLNELIDLGNDAKHNETYSQFRNQENRLMPAGLIGPVTIKSVDNIQ